MKIDNSRNSAMPSTDVGSVESKRAGKWEGPDFDASKSELLMDSQAQREMASSVAQDSKGILNTEANLRRFKIDRDLDPPDMAKEKKNQFSIKQQILEYPSGS
jgi:hypothetical protein